MEDQLDDNGRFLRGGAFAIPAPAPFPQWRLSTLRVRLCHPDAFIKKNGSCSEGGGEVRFTGGGWLGNPQNIPGYDDTTPVLITRVSKFTWTIEASAVTGYCHTADTTFCAGDVANLRAWAVKNQGPTHEGNYVMPTLITVTAPTLLP